MSGWDTSLRPSRSSSSVVPVDYGSPRDFLLRRARRPDMLADARQPDLAAATYVVVPGWSVRCRARIRGHPVPACFLVCFIRGDMIPVCVGHEEADDRQLVAFIHTDLEPREALAWLDQFDRAWWLQATHSSRGKLCIYLGVQPALKGASHPNPQIAPDGTLTLYRLSRVGFCPTL